MRVHTCECGGASFIKNTRRSGRENVYRRRICSECGARWSTIEIPYEYLKDMDSLRKAAWVLSDMASKLGGNDEAAEVIGNLHESPELLERDNDI